MKTTPKPIPDLTVHEDIINIALQDARKKAREAGLPADGAWTLQTLDKRIAIIGIDGRGHRLVLRTISGGDARCPVSIALRHPDGREIQLSGDGTHAGLIPLPRGDEWPRDRLRDYIGAAVDPVIGRAFAGVLRG